MWKALENRTLCRDGAAWEGWMASRPSSWAMGIGKEAGDRAMPVWGQQKAASGLGAIGELRPSGGVAGLLWAHGHSRCSRPEETELKQG